MIRLWIKGVVNTHIDIKLAEAKKYKKKINFVRDFEYTDSRNDY